MPLDVLFFFVLVALVRSNVTLTAKAPPALLATALTTTLSAPLPTLLSALSALMTAAGLLPPAFAAAGLAGPSTLTLVALATFALFTILTVHVVPFHDALL